MRKMQREMGIVEKIEMPKVSLASGGDAASRMALKGVHPAAGSHAARTVGALGLTLALAFGTLGLAGCTAGGIEVVSDDAAATDTTDSTDTSLDIDMSAMDFDYTNRDMDDTWDAGAATEIALAGTGATVTGAGATVSGSTVTVSQAGTYVVSGQLDGSIVVDATSDDKIQLVLNGATINAADGPAVWVKQADKVFVTLAAGTENALTDTITYTLEDGEDEPNATLFSKDDLTINGQGALSITGNYMHAVNSKDDLVITGGTFDVTAAEDALRGHDCVKICGGIFQITSGEDAIKSNKDDDGTKGYVSIDGGTFSINAGDDAIHAETVLQVNGGNIDITACSEGLEGEQVYVNDGTVNVVSSDDGINAAARSTVTGGSASFDFGDATFDAPQNETGVTGEGDQGDAPQMPDGEGQDGQGDAPEMPDNAGDFDPGNAGDSAPEMPDGAQTPDGFDPMQNSDSDASGADDANVDPNDSDFDFTQMGGGMGGMAGASESCLIQINGGTITIYAGGDGIDSNGSVEITGGTLLVSGPASSADSALDYESSATISGGTVIFAGPSGMAENFTSGTQPFAMVNASGKAGSTVTLMDQNGQSIASLTVKNAFDCVIVSCPDVQEGESVTVDIDGQQTTATVSTTATSTGGFGGGMGAGGGGGKMDAANGAADAGNDKAGGMRGGKGGMRDGTANDGGQPSAGGQSV
jgi:hypothetical protein